MSYICVDCRRQFDEPHVYEERHGLEHGPYEKLSCCPFCGGSYEEAIECDECGKIVPESEVCFSEEPWHRALCPECYRAEEDAIEPRKKRSMTSAWVLRCIPTTSRL